MKDTMKDTIDQFSGVSIALHWGIALGIISMLALGLYMESYEVFFLYPIHKSIGILLFAFVLWRIWRRMRNGWQQPVRDFPRAQFLLMRASHWALLTGSALMPLSGMLMNVASGRGLAVFGISLLAANRDAAGEITAHSEALAHFAHSEALTHFAHSVHATADDAAGEIIAHSEALAHFAHSVHATAGKVLIAVIVLHFCAAMKHHFFDKDRVLRRMLGIR
ncbi:MAG: cytochrome b [Gammaproteobacteria bacterium]